MGEEQVQTSLAESWGFVREQRRRTEAQVAQLSTLEVAEFTKAARHIVEVAQELQGIAKHEHLARLENEIKRFTLAAERVVEASEQLQLALQKAEIAAPPSMELLPATSEATTHTVMAPPSSVGPALGQMDGSGNGRAIKHRAK